MNTNEQRLINHLSKKYATYVSNISWHIKTNHPTGKDLEKIETQLTAYKEILSDLSPFLRQ